MHKNIHDALIDTKYVHSSHSFLMFHFAFSQNFQHGEMCIFSIRLTSKHEVVTISQSPLTAGYSFFNLHYHDYKGYGCRCTWLIIIQASEIRDNIWLLW